MIYAMSLSRGHFEVRAKRADWREPLHWDETGLVPFPTLPPDSFCYLPEYLGYEVRNRAGNAL